MKNTKMKNLYLSCEWFDESPQIQPEFIGASKPASLCQWTGPPQDKLKQVNLVEKNTTASANTLSEERPLTEQSEPLISCAPYDSPTLAEANAMPAEAEKHWPTVSAFQTEIYEKYVEDRVVQPFFEPRRIVPPGGYHSPKCIAGAIYAQLAGVSYNQVVLPDEIEAQLLMYAILNARVPVFYIDDAFVRAVAATKLPDDFIVADLKWPMPALVLGFPTKFMKEYTDRDICYVYAADLADGEHAPPSCLTSIFGFCPTLTCPAQISFEFNSGDGFAQFFVAGCFKNQRPNDRIRNCVYTDYADSPPNRIADNETLADRMGSLVLKLLLILNIRPALVKTGQVVRQHKMKHGKSVGELWSANIIGVHYRTQRQPAGDGTQASPRWHWRRGHITHQRIGSLESPDFVSVSTIPRREDGEFDWDKAGPDTRDRFWRSHRRNWLEPILINFDEPNEHDQNSSNAS